MHPVLSRLLFVPTFLWNFLLGRLLRRRHWWDRVEDHLLIGALPLKRDVQALAGEGVVAVVNMCKEYQGPTSAYSELGIEQLWLPTVDFNPPSLEDTRRGVDFIASRVNAGQTVYVHCKAGRARSATVVLCFLMAHRGMTIEEAQAFLLSKRPHVNPRLARSPTVIAFAQGMNRYHG